MREFRQIKLQHAQVRAQQELVIEQQRDGLGKLQAGKEMFAPIIDTMLRVRVKQRQTILCHDPIEPVPVATHRVHQIGDKAVLFRVVPKGRMSVKQRIRREDIQASGETKRIHLRFGAFNTLPYENIHYIIAVQRVFIVGPMSVDTKADVLRPG